MNVFVGGQKARMVALTAVAGGALLVATACSSDDGGSGNAEVINAVNIIENAGLHTIDESVNNEKTIPADARTTALKLQAVVELTEWPSELEDKAENLVKTFAAMVTALDGDNPDMVKAGEAAKAGHEVGHDFAGDVWSHLYEEAGIEGAGGEH